jgi:glycine dehydrogenase
VTSAPFSARHLGPSEEDRAAMLADLGVSSLADLVDEAVPGGIRQSEPLDLPQARSEHEVLAELRTIADENVTARSYLGLGYHGTITPPVLRRNLLENPAWYTAYTPYQPEISQGRLEALLTYQTMVADLTGMHLANASLLDEGTAVAEAVTMCRRSSRHAGRAVLLDAELFPQSRAVVDVRIAAVEIEGRDWVHDPAEPAAAMDDDVFAIVLQTPATSGALRDLAPVAAAAAERGILVVVATDLLACTLLAPPGEWGADVVVGTSQRFGVPMMAGGPHAASWPPPRPTSGPCRGRLVGVSVDTHGPADAFRLALQTREQHIRREKATSNICTPGPAGQHRRRCTPCTTAPRGSGHRRARPPADRPQLVADLEQVPGVEVRNADAFFDTVTVRPRSGAGIVVPRRRARHQPAPGRRRPRRRSPSTRPSPGTTSPGSCTASAAGRRPADEVPTPGSPRRCAAPASS